MRKKRVGADLTNLKTKSHDDEAGAQVKAAPAAGAGAIPESARKKSRVRCRLSRRKSRGDVHAPTLTTIMIAGNDLIVI